MTMGNDDSPRGTGPQRVSNRQRRRAEHSRARQRARRLQTGIVAAVIAVVVGVVLLAAYGGGNHAVPASASTSTTGWDLPPLSGGGNDIRLASFEGQPTVVNFFASWCDQCRAELPGFSSISKQLRGKVHFVGVNSLETGDGLAMARQFGIDWWPLARDIDGQQDSGLHDALGGQGMPMTAFYDAKGNLLTAVLGALPEQALRDELQKLYGITV
jgi:thiol-disulfide isomerase/thioredoxin